MTTPKERSMLLIASDLRVAEVIASAAAEIPNLYVEQSNATLSGLNGTAVNLAARHSLVVFQTDPKDRAEIEAIRTLSTDRRTGDLLVALADDSISLAQVHALTEAGVDEVLPLPHQREEAVAVIERLGSRIAVKPEAERGPGRLFVVMQARGGIGASTIAVNLADQLRRHHRGRKAASFNVALADFDLQYGTLGSMLDLREHDGFLDLTDAAGVPNARQVASVLSQHRSGLAVLTAPRRITSLETLGANRVDAIIHLLREQYDYTVVDLPRAMVEWIEPVIEQSDALMLVTDTSVPAVRHCRRLMDFLRTDHPALPIRLIVNHESRPLFGSAANHAAAKVLEQPFSHWLPHDAKAARAAADRGAPLAEVAARSPLTRAIARMAKAMVHDFPASESIHVKH